jgi:hypothetical protein
LNDLSAKQPERVQQMDAHYRAWAARCGVLTPDELKKRRAAKKG